MIENEGDDCTSAIVFCNRKVDVDLVAKSLKKHGYNAEPIHGDLDQSRRMEVLSGFRDGSIKFLCASDVAARGLDIPNVSHVFNFDVPSHAEDYVHRIGRTGRAGKTGTALMICVPKDEKNLEDIERLVKQPVPLLDNPLDSKKGAAPAPKASAQKDETVEEKPKRSRRARKPKESADTSVEAKTEPKVEQQAQPKAEPKPAPKPAAKPKPREKTPPKDNRRGGNNGNRNQPKGMGNHLPDFIAKSFDDRRDS